MSPKCFRKFSMRSLRGAIAVLVVSVMSFSASALELKSPDIANGKQLNIQQVFNGFGCEGANLSPALNWSKVPAGTRSFAITAYDPDAPTGSGWWHWVVYDIPAESRGLPQGSGVIGMSVTQGIQARSDFGVKAFGGACPPKGDKPHRYVFTVYALKADKLNISQDASPAMIGFVLRDLVLDKATLTAHYAR